MTKRKTKSKPKREPVRVIAKLTSWTPDFKVAYWKPKGKWFTSNHMCGHLVQVMGDVVHPPEFAGRKVQFWFLRVPESHIGDDATKSIGVASVRHDDENIIDTQIHVDRDSFVELIASVGVRAHAFGTLTLQPEPRNQFLILEASLRVDLHEADLALVEGRPPV